MTSSSPPAALDQYPARRGFAPSPQSAAWRDRDTAQQIIRVLREPGETTLPHCPGPHRGCVYEAVLSRVTRTP